MGRMVRKQVYLTAEQDRQLKQRAARLGVSEAELIRQGLDKVLGTTPPPGQEGLALPAAVKDPEAWKAHQEFVESRMKMDVPQSDWKFNREELYEERLSRWLGPKDS
jgi:hypothetical protein